VKTAGGCFRCLWTGRPKAEAGFLGILKSSFSRIFYWNQMCFPESLIVDDQRLDITYFVYIRKEKRTLYKEFAKKTP